MAQADACAVDPDPPVRDGSAWIDVHDLVEQRDPYLAAVGTGAR